ncbi:MAG: pantoate--beta-alanine ligase [Bdellovibrionales bacterium]|nr:pantoate--beta-alanine ligase [Bdellovibrionales bacterium]
MKRLDLIAELSTWRDKAPGRVGFVPTMGALHAGHLALVERAAKECDQILVSIFVNPTQFNDPKDLEKYPRTLERDLELLKAAGADAVFLPQAKEIYNDAYRFEIREKDFSRELCGATRPGHFEGVLTVVMKLFQLARPDRSYFGEKDFQQLTLIQDMARAFFLPIEVVPCPTVREADGLAMSSRNILLTPAEREKAPLLYRTLTSAATVEEARHQLQEAGFRVDYVEEKRGRRFAAAFLGGVRLIDNVQV